MEGGLAVKKVIKILMKRDKISYDEAKDLVLQCIEALESGDENAIQDYLGLEDDYIFDLLEP